MKWTTELISNTEHWQLGVHLLLKTCFSEGGVSMEEASIIRGFSLFAVSLGTHPPQISREHWIYKKHFSPSDCLLTAFSRGNWWYSLFPSHDTRTEDVVHFVTSFTLPWASQNPVRQGCDFFPRVQCCQQASGQSNGQSRPCLRVTQYVPVALQWHTGVSNGSSG
jgi:hypothetical protein